MTAKPAATVHSFQRGGFQRNPAVASALLSPGIVKPRPAGQRVAIGSLSVGTNSNRARGVLTMSNPTNAAWERGYQDAIDNLLNYRAIDHVGHVAEGDDACQLCIVAKHCAADLMTMLTRLGLAPDPREIKDGGP